MDTATPLHPEIYALASMVIEAQHVFPSALQRQELRQELHELAVLFHPISMSLDQLKLALQILGLPRKGDTHAIKLTRRDRVGLSAVIPSDGVNRLRDLKGVAIAWTIAGRKLHAYNAAFGASTEAVRLARTLDREARELWDYIAPRYETRRLPPTVH